MYYAQRKSIANGQPVAPNNRYGEDRREMERQYHLYCASACDESNTNTLDEIEWGTLELGAIERKVWTNPAPEAVAPEE